MRGKPVWLVISDWSLKIVSVKHYKNTTTKTHEKFLAPLTIHDLFLLYLSLIFHPCIFVSPSYHLYHFTLYTFLFLYIAHLSLFLSFIFIKISIDSYYKRAYTTLRQKKCNVSFYLSYIF